MKVNRRHFLRLSFGGTGALCLAPLLRPGALLAGPIELPPNYLESRVHAQWMKLSYSHGRESRQSRRLLGAALRNLGSMRGGGAGDQFARLFDQAVHKVFQRYTNTANKPASLFGLIQALYDEHIFAEAGVPAGRILFGMLLAILRGRDGTPAGAAAYQAYLAYRAAALEHKNAYRSTQDPKQIEAVRRKRWLCREIWQQELGRLVEAYALNERVLPRQFTVEPAMLEGFDLILAPLPPAAPRLSIARVRDRILVSWQGGGRLQQAPTVLGPWSDVPQGSPAVLDLAAKKMFYRTVQPEPRSAR